MLPPVILLRNIVVSWVIIYINFSSIILPLNFGEIFAIDLSF
jgi:hypothetical protein